MTVRVAIVGMTPAPDQLKLACAKVRGISPPGRPKADIYKAAVEAATFGGDLREPLLVERC